MHSLKEHPLKWCVTMYNMNLGQWEEKDTKFIDGSDCEYEFVPQSSYYILLYSLLGNSRY